MDNAFPGYIDEVLNDWDTIAKYSYDRFENIGRGIVVVFNDNNNIEFGYADKEYFVKNHMQKEIDLIQNYDPAFEMLIHFEYNNGSRTIRIKTPEGGRDPKSIWFMDMLMKLTENPNELPENMPDWFYDKALSFIEGLKELQNKNKKDEI